MSASFPNTPQIEKFSLSDSADSCQSLCCWRRLPRQPSILLKHVMALNSDLGKTVKDRCLVQVLIWDPEIYGRPRSIMKRLCGDWAQTRKNCRQQSHRKCFNRGCTCPGKEMMLFWGRNPQEAWLWWTLCKKQDRGRQGVDSKSQLLWNLRQEDHLHSWVWEQPGQHSKNPISKREKKLHTRSLAWFRTPFPWMFFDFYIDVR